MMHANVMNGVAVGLTIGGLAGLGGAIGDSIEGEAAKETAGTIGAVTTAGGILGASVGFGYGRPMAALGGSAAAALGIGLLIGSN